MFPGRTLSEMSKLLAKIWGAGNWFLHINNNNNNMNNNK